MGRGGSPPHVTFVVINPVFIQEIQILLLKCPLLVMFALALDVADHVGQVRFTHRERSVGWFNRRYATGKYLAGNRGLKPTAKFIGPLRGGEVQILYFRINKNP